jgi:hypothetical protein
MPPARRVKDVIPRMPADYYSGIGKDSYIQILNNEQGIYNPTGLIMLNQRLLHTQRLLETTDVSGHGCPAGWLHLRVGLRPHFRRLVGSEIGFDYAACCSTTSPGSAGRTTTPAARRDAFSPAGSTRPRYTRRSASSAPPATSRTAGPSPSSRPRWSRPVPPATPSSSRSTRAPATPSSKSTAATLNGACSQPSTYSKPAPAARKCCSRPTNSWRSPDSAAC